LEVVGWRLDQIILVSNGRVDADSIATRSILARGLLSRLRLMGKGHLTLTVDERLGRRAAADIRTLTVSLERSLRGVPVGLTARVGERSWHADEQLADAVVSRGPSGPFRSATG
jgi:hypothetical protein